jgi:hypothetical protein
MTGGRVLLHAVLKTGELMSKISMMALLATFATSEFGASDKLQRFDHSPKEETLHS